MTFFFNDVLDDALNIFTHSVLKYLVFTPAHTIRQLHLIIELANINYISVLA